MMEVKHLHVEGNTLRGEFYINHTTEEKYLELCSQQYLCGAVFFQLKVLSARCTSNISNDPNQMVVVFASITKMLEYDDLTYICRLTCNDVDMKFHFHDENIWHKIFSHSKEGHKNNNYYFTIKINVQMDIAPGKPTFASLYEDTESTDFKMCGECDEDEVMMHRVILMSASPVLHAMLNGKWKESKEGVVGIASASLDTLGHLKDYIYLDKLPQTGLEQLLLLASYYMMPDLVLKCTVKLLNGLNARNIMELVEFAAKYKVNNLMMAVLRHIQNQVIKVDSLHGYVKWNDECKTIGYTLK